MLYPQLSGRKIARPLRPALILLASLLLLVGPVALGAATTKVAAANVTAYRKVPRVTTAGVFQNTGSTFSLRYSNTAGPADASFRYGPTNSGFTCTQPPLYCTSGWFPLAGDWDGDGTDTVGLYQQSTGTFFLKNTNAAGAADMVFPYGPAGVKWFPVAGDWDGDGVDTVGLYDGSTGHFYLKNTNAAGLADLVFPYGPANSGWFPIVGDWNGDGADTVGLLAPDFAVFFLKDTNAAGSADLVFKYTPTGQVNSNFIPVVGDWDANGSTSVGMWDANAGTFYLKNTNAEGAADLAFPFGPAPANFFDVPVVGSWRGDTQPTYGP